MKSTLNKAKSWYRSRTLAKINRSALRETVEGQEKDTLVFFIFTPELVHFAPYCIPTVDQGFQPIIVLNSVSKNDTTWLRSSLPNTPIVALTTSLRGNTNSMLAHAEVLNYLFDVCQDPFVIQDPDCFVTDLSFWKTVKVGANHFAGGPFAKRPSTHEHVLPDTFFLIFNCQEYRQICDLYQIDANVRTQVPALAQQQLRKIGYEIGQYPENFKAYFDTLQAYWLLALAKGLEFNLLSGADDKIFHIGGTSYMHRSDYELTHWDCWPLSVHYFNLRLLERKDIELFKPRFQSIFDLHGSADDLLRRHPEFLSSGRYPIIESILHALQ